MQFLPILSLRELEFIGAGVLALIVFVWFLARLSHRPYFVVGQSEAHQMAVMQLNRIADSLDKLNRALESRARTEEANAEMLPEEKHSGMGLSMFGR